MPNLWLLRPGSPSALDASLRAFAGTALDAVLVPRGSPARSWAEAHARSSGAELLALPDDAPLGGSEAPEGWSALLETLAAHARCLVVLELAPLLATVGRALDLGPEGPRRMAVDPGRAVHLHGGPRGFELRRSNVLGPEAEPGMSLPSAPDGARC